HRLRHGADALHSVGGAGGRVGALFWDLRRSAGEKGRARDGDDPVRPHVRPPGGAARAHRRAVCGPGGTGAPRPAGSVPAGIAPGAGVAGVGAMSGQPPSEEAREALHRERRRFRGAVERQGERRRRARRAGDRGFWFGLSSFGMVGWSIAVPTLLGVAIGLWLDARLGGGIRYTLSFLIAGLVLGMTNVWRWIQL